MSRSRKILVLCLGGCLVSVGALPAQGAAGWGQKLYTSGKWVLNQLVDYQVSKSIDWVAGEDYEGLLRQAEDGLSREIRQNARSTQQLRVELDAARSQLKVLNALSSKKPLSDSQIDQFKKTIVADLEHIKAIQRQQGVRLDSLESNVIDLKVDMGDLKARMEKLEKQEPEVRRGPKTEDRLTRLRQRSLSDSPPQEPYYPPARSSRGIREGVTLELRITGSFNRITIKEGAVWEELDSGSVTVSGSGQSRMFRVLQGTGVVILVSGKENTIITSGELDARARVVDRGERTRRSSHR